MGKSQAISLRTRYGYAAGDFGLNFYWQGASFFLLFFYTDILALPSTVAGIVFAIGGVIDGVADPIMGLIAERTRSSQGKYRPYLRWGSLPLALSFIGLFGLPWMMGEAGLVVGAAIIGHVIFRLLYTVVSIPYAALGTCLTFDPKERTRLAGARMIFGALGGIGVVSMISGLRAVMGDGAAFMVGAAVSGLLSSCLLMITLATTREQSPAVLKNRASPSQAGSAGGDDIPARDGAYDIDPAGLLITLKAMFANGPFLRLSHAIFAITLANMVVVKTVLYRFEHIFDAPAIGGTTLMVMTAIPLVSIPLWVQFYLRLDKRPAFLLGCLCVALSSLFLSLVGMDWPYISLVAYGLVAGSLSAFAVGFWSILPDTIDHGHATTGIRAESSLVGLASAIQKIAIALAGLGLGVALDLIGYVGGTSQSAEVLVRLHWLSSLAPVVFALLGLIIFYGYDITGDGHADSLRRIEQADRASAKHPEERM